MKKKSKALAITLCVALICTLIPVGIFASADEPIINNGFEELKNIAKNEESLKENYKLGSDITFGDEAITPIGDNDHPFTGTFDLVVSLITSIRATAHSMFYSDANGNIQELGHGTAGQVLTSNGATSAPSWESGSGDIQVDGGFANSTYLPEQSVDGGDANG